MSRKKSQKKKPRKNPIAQKAPSRQLSRRVALFAGGGILLVLIHRIFRNTNNAPPDFEIVKSYPHDPKAFTQGLLYDKGFLYESTGLHGESTLRKVEVETGKVLKSIALKPRYFAEGLTLWKDRLIQLTWESHTGFVYDKETFSPLREFSYETEGWGLTHDGERLIMSDGTATLRFLDPETFQVTGSLLVLTSTGRPVSLLNELEFVQGEIYANILNSNRIARISPQSGRVSGWIDLTSIMNQIGINSTLGNVLNGIAYDPEGERLFVTGKLWPKIFEIQIK